jgi:hypothetical protein
MKDPFIKLIPGLVFAEGEGKGANKRYGIEGYQ